MPWSRTLGIDSWGRRDVRLGGRVWGGKAEAGEGEGKGSG